MRIVVDCSVAVPWFLLDESNSRSEDILKKVLNEGMMIPSLFYFELANVLKTASHKKRISQDEIQGIVQLLSKLPIQLTEIQPSTLFSEVIDFAVKQQLSVYDACYLWLACHHDAPLATFDVSLQKAARGMGIEVLL